MNLFSTFFITIALIAFVWNFRKTHSILTGYALIDSIMASKIKRISSNDENFILQVPHHGSKDN